MTKSESGSLGALATHKKRNQMIVELSKYVDKPYQNFLLKWKTDHLERLLNAYKKQ